jgi:hypothetical protein
LKLKDRFKHIEIGKMNFKTQYLDNFIVKTRIALLDNNSWKLYYYSFEIKDDILSYAPCCPLIEAYEKENLKPFLALDPLITKGESLKLWLNEDEFYLFKMAKRYISLNNIINSFIIERKKIDVTNAKANVIDFYEKLENYGMLYYSKILN